MSFKQEILQLTKNANSTKLDLVKEKLISSAQKGKYNVTIYSDSYDNETISWLESEGFLVEYNQWDGHFIIVSW